MKLEIGQIVDLYKVAQVFERHLQHWVDTYIGEMSLQNHGNTTTLLPVKTWLIAQSGSPLENLGVNHPVLAIIPKGINQFSTTISGCYSGILDYGIAVLTQTRDEQSAIRNIAEYMAAVRTCLIQNPDLSAMGISATISVEAEDIHYQKVERFNQAYGFLAIQIHVKRLVQPGELVEPVGRKPRPSKIRAATITTPIT